MLKQLLRLAPSLIILLAAMVYAAATFWRPQPVSVNPNATAALADFKLTSPKPPQAECDALRHYIPPSTVPLFGNIVEVGPDTIKVKNNEGTHVVALVSATRITIMGTLKSTETFAAETTDFSNKARACNDGTRVYVAPEKWDEVAISATTLKPGKGVQVYPNDRSGNGVIQAAEIILMKPLKSLGIGTPPMAR